MPAITIVESGVALSKMTPPAGAEVVITCGLAGGLDRRLATGTVLVPSRVRRPTGEIVDCDPAIVAALANGARRLGYEPVLAPMLTSATLVRGASRRHWAEQGFAGVDMETGLLHAPRVAAIRVVLDTPQHELFGDWLRPAQALCNPANWREAWWLAREGSRCTRLAARVLRTALQG